MLCNLHVLLFPPLPVDMLFPLLLAQLPNMGMGNKEYIIVNILVFVTFWVQFCSGVANYGLVGTWGFGGRQSLGRDLSKDVDAIHLPKHFVQGSDLYSLKIFCNSERSPAFTWRLATFFVLILAFHRTYVIDHQTLEPFYNIVSFVLFYILIQIEIKELFPSLHSPNFHGICFLLDVTTLETLSVFFDAMALIH